MINFIDARPFKREFRRLLKKHRSLVEHYEALKADLRENPLQGADLGNGLRKVRMAIRSKGKGKSGGARVITYVEAITAEKDGALTFLYIYDKSERNTIADCELAALLEELV